MTKFITILFAALVLCDQSKAQETTCYTSGRITTCETSPPPAPAPPAMYGGGSTSWSVFLGPHFQTYEQKYQIFVEWITNYRPPNLVVNEYNGALLGEYVGRKYGYVSIENLTEAERHLRRKLQYEPKLKRKRRWRIF